MPDAWDDIERQWQELDRRQAAAARVPKYTSKILTTRLGVAQTTLTNWLTRKIFVLDADKHRQPNTTRLFSVRDAVLLTCASHLVTGGMPLQMAKVIAERFVAGLDRMTIVASARSPTLILFPRDQDGWIIAHLSGDGSLISGQLLTPGGDMRPEPIAAEQLPPMYFVFEPERFRSDVFQKLGESFAVGTAKDLRREAERLEELDRKKRGQRAPSRPRARRGEN